MNILTLSLSLEYGRIEGVHSKCIPQISTYPNIYWKYQKFMWLSGSTSDLPKEPTPLLREATSANEDIEELGSGGQADPAIHSTMGAVPPQTNPPLYLRHWPEP